MTEHYLVGELSALLADLQPVSEGLLSDALCDLRREVEASPPWGLRPLAARALTLSTSICWINVESGDMTRFADTVDVAVRVREFSLNANLLPEITEVSL